MDPCFQDFVRVLMGSYFLGLFRILGLVLAQVGLLNFRYRNLVFLFWNEIEEIVIFLLKHRDSYFRDLFLGRHFQ